jgi:hypothetical protein
VAVLRLARQVSKSVLGKVTNAKFVDLGGQLQQQSVRMTMSMAWASPKTYQVKRTLIIRMKLLFLCMTLAFAHEVTKSEKTATQLMSGALVCLSSQVLKDSIREPVLLCAKLEYPVASALESIMNLPTVRLYSLIRKLPLFSCTLEVLSRDYLLITPLDRERHGR